MDTGKVETYESGEGNFLPIVRSGPPPCGDCPKQSPQDEHRFILSRRNQKLWDLYRRAKSMPGFRFPKHLDGCQLLQESFAIIDEVEREAKEAAQYKAQQDLFRVMLLMRTK